MRDEKGAIFIDRDPKIFSIILNYLRTREIELNGTDIRTLRHEAEYYNIAPLVKRLMLCEELTQSTCGDVLFYGSLPPPCKFSDTIQHIKLNSNISTDIPIQDCSNGVLPFVETTAVHQVRPGSSIRMPECQNGSGDSNKASTSTSSECGESSKNGCGQNQQTQAVSQTVASGLVQNRPQGKTMQNGMKLC